LLPGQFSRPRADGGRGGGKSIVEVDAKIVGGDVSLKIVGVDVFRAGFIQPGLIASGADRLDTLRPDALFLSPAAARWLAVAAGSTVHVQVGLAAVPLRVAGALAAGGNQRFAVMDIGGAQSAFDRLGTLSRIDFASRQVSTCRVRRAIAPDLPPGLAVLRLWRRSRPAPACRGRIASISTLALVRHRRPARVRRRRIGRAGVQFAAAGAGNMRGRLTPIVPKRGDRHRRQRVRAGARIRAGRARRALGRRGLARISMAS
jgi:hypothetical protein